MLCRYPECLLCCGGTEVCLESHAEMCVYVSLQQARSGISGDFMGFSDNESESETSDAEVGDKKKDSISSNRPLLNYYSNILFEEQLLEGLSNWMDRLFEGTTVRYHINYWPDWPGK
ncbi:hypothetical protein GWK47_007484 [Chionoecetes opilio]|uniref:Uncharacterized protein n=1 Tax=Chionoecetes opilio TaxID=41210 RepID=A0A8J4Y9N2_CHIOP|nr:hypothetical protein GWK47_007484 [Chionoecetes opilio]